MALAVTSSRSLSLKRAVAQKPVASSAFARRVAAKKQPRFVVRAEQTETTTTSADFDKVLKDLQTKWDGVENKTSVVVYGVGAVVLLWFSSVIVGAINKVPVLPKLMELIGLAYSAWFTYRYLLFKSSREELSKDVEELKKKITGSE